MSMMLIAAAAAAVVTGPVPVDAGRANWSAYPAARLAPRALPTNEMIARVERMLAERACRLRGQSAEEFDITVPYLALVQPDGSLARVVVADMGCPQLETLVGEVVLSRARLGDFQPTGAAQARWYASNINFNLNVAE